MRVLVLHSDVAAGALPDEVDTLVTAQSVAAGLAGCGHTVARAAFVSAPAHLADLVASSDSEIVFNLVESVHGDGLHAAIVPAMLERLGVAYTGSGAAPLALTADKALSKQVMRASGLPTADWAVPPQWNRLVSDRRYVVKSITEDASLGLDDGAVVSGRDAPRRAADSRLRHGGRWFAEAYLDGREFNVALLEDASSLQVLPIPEMRFEAWDDSRPRIVGYAAKWDEGSADAKRTVRAFGIENVEPKLGRTLDELARASWELFGLRGYARVDFRLDGDGNPMILEINANPCLEPNAGFAAAAAQAGISYAALVDRVLRSALPY
ncbi:MAG: D-alanine--D-alanine ligase [Rhizomicrobium sp.]|jgi:D-alanine-D-alanine ligase